MPYTAQPTLGLVEMRTLRALLDALLGHEALWPRFSSPDTEQPQQQYLGKCSLFELSRNNGEEQALLGQFVQCIFRCPTQAWMNHGSKVCAPLQ